MFNPLVSSSILAESTKFEVVQDPRHGYDQAFIVAVTHNQFRVMGIEKIRELCVINRVAYDIKAIFPVD